MEYVFAIAGPIAFLIIVIAIVIRLWNLDDRIRKLEANDHD